MPTEKSRYLGLAFDTAPSSAILSRIAATRDVDAFRYVVTPNVDHVVRLHGDDEDSAVLHDAYDNAELCLCDSRILRALAGFSGIRLPLVTGSDLTAMLFAEVIAAGDRIAIVGGPDDIVPQLQTRCPGVEFVQLVPPMGLRHNSAARSEAAGWVAGQKARFTFLCIGSPQQELIAAEVARNPAARGLALCCGASLDFIVGSQSRAPRLVRQAGLEWAYRLLTNPRRLWRRYLVEGPRIFVLAYRYRKGARKDCAG